MDRWTRSVPRGIVTVVDIGVRGVLPLLGDDGAMLG